MRALPSSTRRRGLVLALLAAGLAVLLALAARQAVVWRIESRLAALLGPRASVGSVELHANGVTLRGLRVPAAGGSGGAPSARGADGAVSAAGGAGDAVSSAGAASTTAPPWPAQDELRAERIDLRAGPAELWAALRGEPVHATSLVADGVYVSLRRRRGQAVELLPSVFEAEGRARRDRTGSLLRGGWRIDELRVAAARLEIFDLAASAPGRAQRLVVDRVRLRAGPLDLPGLAQPVDIDLDGVLVGPQREGRVRIAGEVAPAAGNARLSLTLENGDLLALQPYLLKVSEAGVARGRIDLSVDATVAAMQLRAPGRVTLSELTFRDPANGVVGNFIGLPRRALLTALSRDGRLETRFSLEGRLDDPAFSLEQSFATRVALGAAEVVGVSVHGLVDGVGGLVKGLLGR